MATKNTKATTPVRTKKDLERKEVKKPVKTVAKVEAKKDPVKAVTSPNKTIAKVVKQIAKENATKAVAKPVVAAKTPVKAPVKTESKKRMFGKSESTTPVKAKTIVAVKKPAVKATAKPTVVTPKPTPVVENKPKAVDFQDVFKTTPDGRAVPKKNLTPPVNPFAHLQTTKINKEPGRMVTGQQTKKSKAKGMNTGDILKSMKETMSKAFK